MSMFNTCLRNGQISLGDDFDNVSEVTGLFGLTATKLVSNNVFDIPNQDNAVACLFSDSESKGWHYIRKMGPALDNHGWNEILSISAYSKTTSKTMTS